MRASPGTMTIEDINYDLRRDFILLMLERGIKIKDDYKDGHGEKSSKTVDGDWFVTLTHAGIKKEAEPYGYLSDFRQDCVKDYVKSLKKFIKGKKGKTMHVRKFPAMDSRDIDQDPTDWFDLGNSLYTIRSRLFI